MFNKKHKWVKTHTQNGNAGMRCERSASITEGVNREGKEHMETLGKSV